MLVDGRKRVEYHPTPDGAQLERLQIHARDDTEVVRTAAESEQEIWILLGVGVDFEPVGQHDPEIGYRVAGPAIAR